MVVKKNTNKTANTLIGGALLLTILFVLLNLKISFIIALVGAIIGILVSIAYTATLRSGLVTFANGFGIGFLPDLLVYGTTLLFIVLAVTLGLAIQLRNVIADNLAVSVFVGMAIVAVWIGTRK